ncbi:MAG TPA: SRPBCC domain-containing protein [Puia sp.]|nr:SRPBCC domain-containing protein [Puia sp.]
MADIFHNFPIEAPAEKVFEIISLSEGLDKWWTKSSEANPSPGGIYTLDFGPGYIWKAIVTEYVKGSLFELKMTEADDDWLGTKVGFDVRNHQSRTGVNFYHTGWPQENEHFKISSYCWAMYLRILKRYIEYGEMVPYEKRLQV